MSQPAATDVHEEAAGWVLRLRAGEGETEAFQRWLAADAANAVAFRQAEASWALFGEHAAAPELLALRRDALSRARRAGRSRWLGRSLSRRSLAAGLAAALAAPLGLLMWSRARAPSTQSYRTGLGEQRTLTLSDGTRMSLDANTRIEVAYSRDARRIELAEGRAHFDVAKDPGRPLTVRAGERTITALGTSFTVEKIGARVIVTLVEGRVAVTGGPLASAGPVQMQPQQQLVLADSAPPVVRHVASLDRVVAWREGKLVFEDETLAQAAARMNNYSRTKIVVEGAEAQSLRVSGMFNAGDTEAFVDAVRSYFPVTATAMDGAIVIRSDG